MKFTTMEAMLSENVCCASISPLCCLEFSRHWQYCLPWLVSMA